MTPEEENQTPATPEKKQPSKSSAPAKLGYFVSAIVALWFAVKVLYQSGEDKNKQLYLAGQETNTDLRQRLKAADSSNAVLTGKLEAVTEGKRISDSTSWVLNIQNKNLLQAYTLLKNSKNCP